MTSRPRLGVAGLGRMGRAAAERLLEQGHRVSVWNRSPGKAEALAEAGAGVVETPRDLAAAADIVILSLTDGAAVEAVVSGEDGVFAGTTASGTIVDISTVPPEVSCRLAEMGREHGVAVLDAPVAGGPALLREGRVGVMAGGEADVFERCRPVLECLGSRVIHVGGNGQGSALKLVNNLLLAIAIEGAAEALHLAERLGLDPRHLFEVSAAGGAQTRAMEVRGPRMVSRDFTPTGALDDLHKDLGAALALASSCDADTPAAAAVFGILERARRMGWGASDSSAVFAALQGLEASRDPSS